ncbi:MAG: hypothetical protein WC382_02415 [Methanoregulaceae archaeon]|jgi:hypothetical protein
MGIKMDYPSKPEGKGSRDDWNPTFSPNGDLRSRENRKVGITNPSLNRIDIRRYRNRRLDHPSRDEYEPS